MLPLELGSFDTGEKLLFSLEGNSHFLVSGRSRSGKSSFVYLFLIELLRRKNWPAVVCGWDPSQIVFSVLNNNNGLSASGLNTEEIRSAFEKILKLLSSRIELLVKLKKDKFSGSDFSKEFPVCFVLVEEFISGIRLLEELDRFNGLRGKDSVANFVKTAILQIAVTGAKAGIYLILVPQKPSIEALGGGAASILRDQIGRKFIFAADRESLRMLFPEVNADLALLAQKFSPGVGLTNDSSAEVRKFRADFVSFEDFVSEFSKGVE